MPPPTKPATTRLRTRGRVLIADLMGSTSLTVWTGSVSNEQMTFHAQTWETLIRPNWHVVNHHHHGAGPAEREYSSREHAPLGDDSSRDSRCLRHENLNSNKGQLDRLLILQLEENSSFDSKNRITWWDAAFRQMLRVVGCWQCGNKTNIYYYYLYCPSTRLGTWLRQFVGQWRCWGVCLSLMQRGRVWGACSLLSGINCIFDFPSPRLLEIYI